MDGKIWDLRGMGEIIDATQYDHERCKELSEQDLTFHDGFCEGLDDIRSAHCKECGYYKDNVAHESPKLEVGTDPREVEKQTMGSLENEIFVKIYTGDACNLNDGIDMLNRVIDRLEDVKKQNAKEALIAFLDSYCTEGQCSKCALSFGNYNCSAKVQLAKMERGEP